MGLMACVFLSCTVDVSLSDLSEYPVYGVQIDNQHLKCILVIIELILILTLRIPPQYLTVAFALIIVKNVFLIAQFIQRELSNPHFVS